MTKQEEFINQVELLLKQRIGAIIAGSILKNNLAKLNKDVSSMTKEDGKLLVKNIINAVSLFAAGGESKIVGTELEKLLPMLD
jgi:hypothetical protein